MNNNADSQREVNEANSLLSQATTLLDESRALSYAVVMALAQTPREELSREEIDGLCQYPMSCSTNSPKHRRFSKKRGKSCVTL